MKLLSTLIAAIFAIVSFSAVAADAPAKKDEAKKVEKKHEAKKVEKKHEAKKAEKK